MARELLYYHEHRDLNGQLVRLEIHCKDEYLPDWYWDSGIPVEMMGLSYMSLNLEGQNGVLNPITKSTLNFSLADCPDTPGCDSEGILDDGRKLYKHGHWEGFYTPDSEAYLVELYTGPNSRQLRLRWSGYITPDSYQESLGYHAVVSISARDNIGHLYDYDFDLSSTDGLVSIRQIIEGAFAKISSPMTLSLETAHEIVFETDGGQVTLLNTLVSTALFEGCKWGEVLERTLESIGFVMRWNDANTILVSSYRDLQSLGVDSGLTAEMDLEFYDGNRIYDPAVKRIVEEIDYNAKESVTEDVKDNPAYFSGDERTYSGRIEAYLRETGGSSSWAFDFTGHHNNLFKNVSRGDGIFGAFLDIDGYTLFDSDLKREGDTWKEYLYMPVNDNAKLAMASISKHTMSTDMDVVITFGAGCARAYTWQGKKTIAVLPDLNIDKIVYTARFVYDESSPTGYMFWDGWSWRDRAAESSAPTEHTVEFDFTASGTRELTISLKNCSAHDYGRLDIQLYEVHAKGCNYIDSSSTNIGYYARLKSVTYTSHSKSIVQSNTVRTINNDTYNVVLNRTPEFAPYSEHLILGLPEMTPKGMFYRSGTSLGVLPYEAHWFGDSDSKPFPVLVHKQMLCFYHEVLELLEGECSVIAYDGTPSRDFEANGLFWYKGRRHLLMSGTWDLLSGRLESASFRGFIPYDELWS